MKILSLFDGMSCGQIALEELGVGVSTYYASEVDKFAIQTTMQNFPLTIQVGDVRNLKADDFKDVDMIIGGSPCQNLSFAGRKKGLSTRDGVEITTLDQYLKLKEEGFEFEGQSYLFWEYIRLLREIKPPFFLLENVNMPNKWRKVFDEIVGVEGVDIDSSLLSGARRPRVYWTNLRIEPLEDRGIKGSDILDDLPMEPASESFYRFSSPGTRWVDRMYRIGSSEKLYTLLTTPSSKTMMLTDSTKTLVRTLSPQEMKRAQTVPDWYNFEGISATQQCKMLGNGWTVEVIKHIFKPLKDLEGLI